MRTSKGKERVAVVRARKNAKRQGFVWRLWTEDYGWNQCSRVHQTEDLGLFCSVTVKHNTKLLERTAQLKGQMNYRES